MAKNVYTVEIIDKIHDVVLADCRIKVCEIKDAVDNFSELVVQTIHYKLNIKMFFSV